MFKFGVCDRRTARHVIAPGRRFAMTLSLAAAALLAGIGPASAAGSEIMVVGIDRKFSYDDAAARQASEPGNDEVVFYDIQEPEAPRLLGSIRLENSILGPPTNVAVTPDQSLALIANAVHSEKTPTGWKAVPADELFVVDLRTFPVKLVQTLKVGRQPSGLSVSRDGKLALVANRDSKSISVIRIENGSASVVDTIDTVDAVGSVAITPDGRRAIATKTLAHKALILAIDAKGQVSIEREVWVGLFPWNVAMSPDGKTALVNNIGNAGQSDGGAKTVSVIDLSAAVPFVREHVSVGDAPEGVAFSPKGDLAAITILQGSYDAPARSWFANPVGQATLLSVDKGHVGVVNSVAVGAFPEGIAFASDGVHVYVGNFHSNSISLLKVDGGGRLVNTGHDLELPGPPASLRIGSR